MPHLDLRLTLIGGPTLLKVGFIFAKAKTSSQMSFPNSDWPIA
jgi:hypothetical protein